MPNFSILLGGDSNAMRVAESLRAAGIPDESISVLTPDTTREEVEAAVPTSDTEQPGMGGALGGTVGAAMGAAGGMHIGAALASLLVPGVGPVLAAGVIGAALLGAGGAVAGAAAGSKMEESIDGLPHDELFVYEDALRKGKSVIIVVTDNDEQIEAARNVLATQPGVESIDAAREDWWVGLRDAEEAEYTGQGGDFKQDEPIYRRGFEAAQHPQLRGKTYADVTEHLRERYSDAYETESFRRGYERGQNYQRSLQEKYKG
jgi:outer membrane lipoprotein SlyB